MTARKPDDWVVAVSSTYRNLKACRRRVIDALHAWGFEALAFEEEDFPVEEKVNAHDAFLYSMQKADYVLLILGKSYGSPYEGHLSHPVTKGASVTHVEYLRARSLRKTFLICVDESLENEWAYWRGCAERDLGPKAGKLATRRYISVCTPRDPEIEAAQLAFLDEARFAASDNCRMVFRSTDELVSRIRERLAGFTRSRCQALVERQVKEVKRQLRGDTLWPPAGVVAEELFVDPPFKVDQRVPSSSSQTICESIGRALVEGESLLIEGGPGMGKSIVLIKAYLNHARETIHRRDYSLPLYLNLADYGRERVVSLDCLIAEVSAKEGRKPYPMLNMQGLRFTLYVDGLDESSPSYTREDLELLAKKELFEYPLVLSARTEFVQTVPAPHGAFIGKFDQVYTLTEWTPELAGALAKRVCEVSQRLDLTDSFERYFSEAAPGLFSSPLLAAMLIYVVISSDMSVPPRVDDEVQLYHLFIERLAAFELRKRQTPATEGDLEAAWMWAAWVVYAHKARGEKVHLADFRPVVQVQSDQSLRSVDDRSLCSILKRRPYFPDEITGLIHERFMEYLVARLFTDACRSGYRKIVEEYLQYNIRYKTNAFIKAIWDQEDRHGVTSAMEFLWDVFHRTSGIDDRYAVSRSANALYYLSYGNNPVPGIALARLWQVMTMPVHQFVRNSALFGLIRLGDMKAEERLYREFTNDQGADDMNRGLHLVYFRDWPSTEPSPHYDNGSHDWSGTYKGLLTHICDPSRRFVHSRRIDLWTIRGFMLKRQAVGPVTRTDLAAMRNSLERDRVQRPEFSSLFKAAEEELDRLIDLWQSLTTSD